MKFFITLTGAFILQLFFTEILLACKTTTLRASGIQMQGALEFVLATYETERNSQIKNIRKEVSGIVVEIIDPKGNCNAELYHVSIQADCSTVVTSATTYEPINCL